MAKENRERESGRQATGAKGKREDYTLTAINVGEGLFIDTERLFKHIPKKIRSIIVLCKNDTGKYVTFIARNDIATFPCPCKSIKESFFKDCMDEINDADI